MYDFDGPDGDDLEKVYAGMKDRMVWIWGYPLDAEVAKAVGMLRQDRALENGSASAKDFAPVEARL